MFPTVIGNINMFVTPRNEHGRGETDIHSVMFGATVMSRFIS